MTRALVEIVCCSADDCAIAATAGADRVELCAALEVGGLTPSVGVLRASRAASTLPIMAMVRPRTAGFCYSRREFESMLLDAMAFADEGAEGIVTGVLDEEGHIDRGRCGELLRAAGSLQKVCHRCFDVTPDPFEALETLIDLGFDRVLTSGQRANCMDGLELIHKLVEKADARIDILPGGGLKASDIPELVKRTGVTQVHLAPFEILEDPSTKYNPEIRFAGISMPVEAMYSRINADAASEIVQKASGAS